MAHRGSLKSCINNAILILQSSSDQYINIVHSKTGSYYSVLTIAELIVAESKGKMDKHRLVFQGTLREIKEFVLTDQLSLNIQG
jgi:hypothetical protein